MSRSVLSRHPRRFHDSPSRRLVNSLRAGILLAAVLVLPAFALAASPQGSATVARPANGVPADSLPHPSMSPATPIRSSSDGSFDTDGRRLRLRAGSLDGGASSGPRGDFVTLSGNKVSTGTTLYYLYPGACTQRYLGTWSPQSSRTWDDLNSYAIGTPGPYDVVDESLDEILWHVCDASMTPADQRPSALDGTRSIWCGKYDPNWIRHVGYPNRTYQILYIDTGAHGGDYTLTFTHRFGVEKNGDFIYLIGGGGGATDPIGNSRNSLDAVIANGASGDARLLVRWTGNITAGSSLDTRSTAWDVEGSGSSPPVTVSSSITIAGQHRALYLVLVSDDFGSSEDGQWPDGEGAVIDQIGIVGNGMIYDDQTAAGVTDTFGGSVILGTPAAPVISARVAPGHGGLWQLYPGSDLITADPCNALKTQPSDLIFFGGDPVTKMLIPGEETSIQSCTFPIPAGTAKVIVRWDDYVDLPKGSGFVQDGQYRFFQNGSWRGWEPFGGIAGSLPAWTGGAIDMADAARADSIQVRLSIRCIPSFAADGFNCQPIYLGLLYDNFSLEVVSGYPAPGLGIFDGAQSTFVDGTILGLNCNVAPCWPGIRGTALQTNPDPDVAQSAVKDNFNSPVGDSIVVEAFSSLRPNGMGINWHHGFSKSFSSGLAIAYVNNSYIPAYDTPRMIYRLFDPTTLSWSPFDSTELDADDVVVGPTDTTVVFWGYRMNWPPRDKQGLNLPGGFSINGIGAYNALSFLPRGTRIQYYFKAVDINGATTYQFTPELGSYYEYDLPTLPGSSIVAPGIMEFDVLPGVYATGSPGSLLAGSKKTPVLNLDTMYGYWVGATDPITRALRGLGVRADRYRVLGGLDEGNNIGGHELPGTRPRWPNNYFPNVTEYPIKDSLAAWYRIAILSSDKRSWPILDEQDARLLRLWWEEPTGVNNGDRCIFGNGDDFFRYLLQTRAGLPSEEQFSLATGVFGVAAINDSWSGSTTVANPTIDDRFAAPIAGPNQAPAGSFTYMLNTKCPMAGRFDALTQIGSAAARSVASYPLAGGMTDVAAVAVLDEYDQITDRDRNKSIGYGFSVQPITWFGNPFVAAQLQVLYKFLTSCRGPRSGSPADTASCWPCPTDATMITNWAASASFQTGTYGPLYPIQDYLMATAVNEGALQGAPGLRNFLAQNRPNPFNPFTTIAYTLSRAGHVVIRVYDVAGRCVATIKDQSEGAGPHEVRWNGLDDSGGRLASGVYFYRITYPGGATSAKRMTILR